MTIPLSDVMPEREICSTWGGGEWYLRGIDHALAARRIAAWELNYHDCELRVNRRWAVAYKRCPDYSREDGCCCFGECDGNPMWMVVKRGTPGAEPVWRITVKPRAS